MIRISTAEARKCLERARLVDDRLKSAVGLVKITTEISEALLENLTDLKPKLLLEKRSEVDNPQLQGVQTGKLGLTSMFGAGSKPTKIGEGISLIALVRNDIEGASKPTDLIAELIAAYVAPEISHPKERKRGERPTFAFFTAGLSTLVNRDDLSGDFRRICECALDETTKLAAAAASRSDAEILSEIRRGIVATTHVPNNVSRLSRHVVAALQAHRILVDQFHFEPIQSEVREAAIEILKRKRQDPYPNDRFDRWREVWKATGLKLPRNR